MRDLAHHQVLAELFAYWSDKRQGVKLPCREDIDPVQIPTLLPFLQFAERAEDGEFRYRLTGTAVVAGFGCDPTGKYLRDVLSPARLAIARRHFSKAWSSGRAIWSRNRYQAPSGAEQLVTRVILPLAEDGRSVSMLLLGQIFEGVWTSFERTGIDWHVRGGDEWGFLAAGSFHADQAAA